MGELARQFFPRHGAAPAHCSAKGSNAEETFHILHWYLTLRQTSPDPGWSLCSGLLEAREEDEEERILSLAVFKHFQHGHNSTALKEIRRKDPQQQNKQGSQTVSP